jgi:DNA-formamidopyrimidine glycosylase
VPELPEVESLARFLEGRTQGLTVASARVLAISALKTFDPPLESLFGRRVARWTRRGKFLVMDTGGVFLAVHLARAGWLRWRDEMPAATAKASLKGPLALRVAFDDGAGFECTEQGTDKRLAVHVARALDDIENVRTLGIDPFDPAFTPSTFASILAGQGRSQVKGVLTDQRLIAGLGNAYSDEALHLAKLSPFAPSIGLVPEAVLALHGAILSALSDAVTRSAGKPAAELKDAKRSGMRVHGRAGQPCPECGDTVREVSFATKSLQYCATCQTGGKPLADRRLSRLLK